MNVGVLALQGCVEPHLRMLSKLGVGAAEVRSPADLSLVDRLILPGGESTTMIKLAQRSGLWAALRDFGRAKPVWGVCAGAILISKETVGPAQESLGCIEIRARRNFYGSQLDSFSAEIEIPVLAGGRIHVDFIRAPLLEPLSKAVTVLAQHQGQSVLLQQGRVLASSFHVELGEDPRLHQYFLEML